MATNDESNVRFPWQTGRAWSEDRAMGLELELIELVRLREVARDEGAVHAVTGLDERIEDTMIALASVPTVATWAEAS